MNASVNTPVDSYVVYGILSFPDNFIEMLHLRDLHVN